MVYNIWPGVVERTHQPTIHLFIPKRTILMRKGETMLFPAVRTLYPAGMSPTKSLETFYPTLRPVIESRWKAPRSKPEVARYPTEPPEWHMRVLRLEIKKSKMLPMFTMCDLDCLQGKGLDPAWRKLFPAIHCRSLRKLGFSTHDCPYESHLSLMEFLTFTS